MNLDEFADDEASQKGSRKKCMTCTLLPGDVLAQVHAGRAREPKPVAFPVISRWLEKEHNIKIQPTTLRSHFVSGHADD